MTQLNFELPQCEIQSIEQSPGMIWIVACSTTKAENCPNCGFVSKRVHSYYSRYLSDLPVGEASLQLQIRVKRFRCLQVHCKRKTFAESLAELTKPFSVKQNVCPILSGIWVKRSVDKPAHDSVCN
jgi:transposase